MFKLLDFRTSLFEGLYFINGTRSYTIVFSFQETVKFFKCTYQKDLCLSDRLEFINFWYVSIIINDLMTIVGSSLKIQIESQRSHNYEICGILLGTGNLMVWFGVLRYLKFFETYNVSMQQLVWCYGGEKKRIRI